MAIIQNNVQNIQFLRNQTLFASREAALTQIELAKENALDGSALLARYTTTGGIKTLVGFVYVNGGTKDITIFDVEGGSQDVDKLRQEINAKLGTTFISSGNTVEANLTALSGTSSDASGVTSVWGAKTYAKDYTDQEIGKLDYTDTAETGSYVSEVNQLDGHVTVSRVALPNMAEVYEEGKPIIAVAEEKGQVSASAGTINADYVNVTGDTFTATSVQGALEEIDEEYKAAIADLDYTDTAAAKKFVTAVSEENGVISVTRGEITSSGETIVLSDNADGGVNFEVHYDGTTIIQDPTTKELKVASSALIQYIGDENTIHVSEVVGDNKTISSLLTISATTPSEANVKEQYNLVGASGNTIGATIKIYKDSALLSVKLLHADYSDPSNPVLPTYDKATDAWTDIPATAQTQANQALCYAYEDVEGTVVVAAVPVGSFINEQEFASGVTWDATANKVKGVVDGTSEGFLTVGEGGFKLSGVQDAINTAVGTAVSGLDATVTAETAHVSVQIDEVDGKLTAVTLNEYDIASADDLAELSAKTVTEIESSNASISAVTATTTDGTVKVDVTTDADKIKMSGFTTTTGNVLSNVTEDSTVTNAVEAIDAALTGIDGRVDTIENDFVSAATVNGSGLTITNNTIALTVESAAATGTESSPIIVETDADGGITLKIQGIDAGFYDGTV